MKELPEVLRSIVVEYGRKVCDEPKRLNGLLRDYLGQDLVPHHQQVNVLVVALEHRAVEELLSASPELPAGIVQRRVAARLQADLAMTEGAARWAVETWAFALGLSTGGAMARAPEPVRSPVLPSSVNRPQLTPDSTAVLSGSSPAEAVAPRRGPGIARRFAVAAALLLALPLLAVAGLLIGLGLQRSGPAESAAPSVAGQGKQAGPSAAVLRLLPMAPVRVEPGQSQNIAVRLERQSCPVPIELRLDGLPPGITVRLRVCEEFGFWSWFYRGWRSAGDFPTTAV